MGWLRKCISDDDDDDDDGEDCLVIMVSICYEFISNKSTLYYYRSKKLLEKRKVKRNSLCDFLAGMSVCRLNVLFTHSH